MADKKAQEVPMDSLPCSDGNEIWPKILIDEIDPAIKECEEKLERELAENLVAIKKHFQCSSEVGGSSDFEGTGKPQLRNPLRIHAANSPRPPPWAQSAFSERLDSSAWICEEVIAQLTLSGLMHVSSYMQEASNSKVPDTDLAKSVNVQRGGDGVYIIYEPTI
ncbi:hypothetical protein B0H13DRAFT_2493454 [Mycena leptocephala]|nr:hypothetical protein B0H13DRAFT_2493454 [Mycena leptocephala]